MASLTLLPSELIAQITTFLPLEDTRTLSRVSVVLYRVCAREIWRSITITSIPRYLAVVPNEYGIWVRNLVVNVPVDRDCELGTLLATLPALRSLTLNVQGSLPVHVLPAFASLPELHSLAIINSPCLHFPSIPQQMPLSERVVVYIAFSLPSLKSLTVSGVSRSAIHSNDTLNYRAMVVGDEDVPDHPTLGKDLYLPQLLKLPRLEVLILKESDLSDARWGKTWVCSPLVKLETGIDCEGAQDDDVARLLGNPGLRCLKEVAIASPLVDIVVEEGRKILPSLKTLNIGRDFPYSSPSPTRNSPSSPAIGTSSAPIFAFPPLSSSPTSLFALCDTLSSLDSTPLEKVSLEVWEDDLGDVVDSLTSFITESRHFGKMGKLHNIELDVLQISETPVTFGSAELDEDTLLSLQALLALCRDSSIVLGVKGIKGFIGQMNNGRNRAWSV